MLIHCHKNRSHRLSVNDDIFIFRDKYLILNFKITDKSNLIS